LRGKAVPAPPACNLSRSASMHSRFSALFLLLATLLLFATSCWNRSPLSKRTATTRTAPARDIRERSGFKDSGSSTRRAKAVPFGAGCCFFFCACNVVLPSPSLAAAASGATLFAQSCSGCHSGGGNLFNGQKTLREADLSKNGYASVEQVAEIISRGKGQMPPYSQFISPKGNEMPAKLSDSEVAAVSNYVVEQVNIYAVNLTIN
jgi:cytochrome c6